MQGKPLTKALKEMIINARKMGKPVKEICTLYFVGKTAVYNVYKEYDETGSLREPLKPSGRPPEIDEATLELVRLRILEKNDITLQELIDEFSLSVSVSALSRTIRKKLKLNFKKNIYIPRNKLVKT